MPESGLVSSYGDEAGPTEHSYPVLLFHHSSGDHAVPISCGGHTMQCTDHVVPRRYSAQTM